MTRPRNLTFSPSAPSSAAGGLAAALAPADVSALAGAKVAPVATAAVDELVFGTRDVIATSRYRTEAYRMLINSRRAS
jgi:hypothetical protein